MMKTIKIVRNAMFLSLAVVLSTPLLSQSAESDAQAVARYKQAEKIGQDRLTRFDTLDFDVYTNQKWDRLKESHAANILVHYPDGHTTRGLPDHIAAISQTFVFAPDTHIRTHPVRIVSASGEWTSVIGVLEGTFTKPMPGPNGTTIAPTGKPFKLQMVTVGHWQGATMDEEYLFYDNQAFMKQIGVD
jgi:SnoaL-like polyketide cyclase